MDTSPAYDDSHFSDTGTAEAFGGLETGHVVRMHQAFLYLWKTFIAFILKPFHHFFVLVLGCRR